MSEQNEKQKVQEETSTPDGSADEQDLKFPLKSLLKKGGGADIKELKVGFGVLMLRIIIPIVIIFFSTWFNGTYDNGFRLEAAGIGFAYLVVTYFIIKWVTGTLALTIPGFKAKLFSSFEKGLVIAWLAALIIAWFLITTGYDWLMGVMATAFEDGSL
jgi:hypothetical protein